MKLNTLMIIKSLVCLAFGPLLLFVPGPLLTLLGSSFGPGAAITSREYGAALLYTRLEYCDHLPLFCTRVWIFFTTSKES